jgi:hypothetical protein
VSGPRRARTHRRGKHQPPCERSVWWCKVPQCEKVCYRSKTDARKELRRHPDVWDQNMVPYRCRDCRYVHLGHQPYAVVMGACTATEWYELLTDDERATLVAVLKTAPHRWFQEATA